MHRNLTYSPRYSLYQESLYYTSYLKIYLTSVIQISRLNLFPSLKITTFFIQEGTVISKVSKGDGLAFFGGSVDVGRASFSSFTIVI